MVTIVSVVKLEFPLAYPFITCFNIFKGKSLSTGLHLGQKEKWEMNVVMFFPYSLGIKSCNYTGKLF